MSKSTYITVLCLWLLSCNKDKNELPPLPDHYWGEATADMNGIKWVGHPNCKIYQSEGKSKFSINLDSLANNYFLTKVLYLHNVPLQVGSINNITKFAYPFDGKTNAHYTFMEYDLVLGDYDILESANNVLTIESIDTITTQEIKGSFDLTFVVTKRPPPDQYPADTIRFKNGKFHGKIRRK